MIDIGTVWQVTLHIPTEPGKGFVVKVLPTLFFSKPRAIAYAIDKMRLFKADCYKLDPLILGDNDPAMEAMLAIRKALKALEDSDD